MIKREVWDGVCEHVPFIVQGQIVSFFFCFFSGGLAHGDCMCAWLSLPCVLKASRTTKKGGLFFCSLSPSPPPHPHPVELRNSVLIMVL